MTMKKRRTPKRRTATALPMMFFQMATASAETIARRTELMLSGGCSAAEYQRMVAEKAKAAMETAVVLTKLGAGKRKDTAAKAIAPWHRAVVANAKRLRKK
jgi:hypothetical protein